MHYTLRQIEVFLATAHFENVTQAAQSLSMSQSAASSALQDLEQRFDVQLFDRAGKRLQLNGLGKSLRPRAEALMAQAREFERSLSLHSEIGGTEGGCDADNRQLPCRGHHGPTSWARTLVPA
jgi:DNA-binding transcriptional LysR family regulator